MPEEFELLQRARALEEAALAEIHDRYYQRLYKYMLFRVSDTATAEDLTSELFIRFLRVLTDKKAPPNSIAGWLFGAAKLVLKEHYRQKKRDNFTPLDERMPNEEMIDPEQAAAIAVEQEQLQTAVSQLSDDQQHVLALRYGFGLSIREAADSVQKSEGAVKMIQARAISALTQLLKGTGGAL